MLYSAFRQKLKDTLNRRDCTDARLDMFVDDAFQRINRTLDHHIREASTTVTVTDPEGTNSVPLPTDAGKKLIEVYVDGIPAESLPERTSLQTYYLGYTRKAGSLIFNTHLPEDTEVQIIYWRNFARPVDAATNAILSEMNSLILYGALIEAGYYYQHARLPEWQAQYDRVLEEATSEYIDREASGYGGPMVVSTPLGPDAVY